MLVSNIHQLEDFGGMLFTQPNQAFTPRQILEQFVRGEVIPSIIQPTDAIIYDGKNEDQLFNDVIEFEDKLDAEGHLLDNQYSLFHESSQNQGGSSVPDGTSQSSVQTPSGNDGQSGGKTETA